MWGSECTANQTAADGESKGRDKKRKYLRSQRACSDAKSLLVQHKSVESAVSPYTTPRCSFKTFRSNKYLDLTITFACAEMCTMMPAYSADPLYYKTTKLLMIWHLSTSKFIPGDPVSTQRGCVTDTHTTCCWMSFRLIWCMRNTHTHTHTHTHAHTHAHTPRTHSTHTHTHLLLEKPLTHM